MNDITSPDQIQTAAILTIALLVMFILNTMKLTFFDAVKIICSSYVIYWLWIHVIISN